MTEALARVLKARSDWAMLGGLVVGGGVLLYILMKKKKQAEVRSAMGFFGSHIGKASHVDDIRQKELKRKIMEAQTINSPFSTTPTTFKVAATRTNFQ